MNTAGGAPAQALVVPSDAPSPARAAALRARWPERQFPDFVLVELKPRSSRHCVCVFVIDEGERIRRQLLDMAALGEQIDIIVADGGSSDGSLDLDHLRTANVRALLTKTGPGRLSAQMRMAFVYVLGEDYEGVVVIDGNDKDDVSAIPGFVRLLEDGYDHVQGSRFIPGGCAINTPLERLLAIRLLHAPIVSLAARRRHTDSTNGFRAYSARLLADERIDVFRDAIGSNLAEASTFTANNDGTYPFIFIDTNYGGGTGSGGPYDFTVYVTHAVVLGVPHIVRVSLKGSQIAVQAHSLDGKPITAPLGLTLSGYWRDQWHVLSTATLNNGSAILHLTLPTSIAGSSIRLKVNESGNGYVSTQSSIQTVLVKKP